MMNPFFKKILQGLKMYWKGKPLRERLRLGLGIDHRLMRHVKEDFEDFVSDHKIFKKGIHTKLFWALILVFLFVD